MWVLRSILGTEDPPNKVLEAKPDQFSSRGICRREDGLILYLPNTNALRRENPIFEIVLHRPASEGSRQTFSLYRAKGRDEAELKFNILRDNLPGFIEIAKGLCNVTGLQRLCDVLFEHPKWNLAHLAAHFGLHDQMLHPKIVEHLNRHDEDDGMSALQVAIVAKNLRVVQVLVEAKCSLEHLDFNNNSVYHYAASSTKEIINVLVQATEPPPACLSALNKQGLTPLHTACLADKPDCVRALITAGADVNKTATSYAAVSPSYVGTFLQNTPNNSLYADDMKDGGTPLHWACSKSVVDALVDMNCHINSQNFQKRTALHVMVMRKRMDCVVALLTLGADPDVDDLDGNRPIHFAAISGDVPIIHALIVFGANLDVRNAKKETARHLINEKCLHYLAAMGAERCPENMSGCKDGCKFDGTFEGIPPPPVREPSSRSEINQMLLVSTFELLNEATGQKRRNNKGRLLALDGGGIRGLILVQVLMEIERVVQRPIVTCFDWIAGTSTGGILALALAGGKSLKECLSLYFRLKEQTFIGTRPYKSDNLESVLKKTFGCESVMADIEGPRVMVTGTMADRKPVELHLFRNYESANRILSQLSGRGDSGDDDVEFQLDPPEKQLIWEVARATGAAPTYFRAFGFFLDGGLIANNPTLDALTEIHEHSLALRAANRENEAAPVSLVLSVGTGHAPVTEIENIDIFRTDSILDHAKLAFGATKFGALLVDQATCSDGRVVDRARAWCSQTGVPYFRFNPQMSAEFDLDEGNDTNLCKMLWECKAYMRKNKSSVVELANLLEQSEEVDEK